MLDISKTQQKQFIGYLDDLHGKHLALPSWEQKLKEAQKILFNHELFSQVVRPYCQVVTHLCITQLSRDAYHQKAAFPYEILSEQIHIPVRRAALQYSIARHF